MSVLKYKRLVLLLVAVICILSAYSIRLESNNSQLVIKSDNYDKQAGELLSTWEFISDFDKTWRNSDRMAVQELVAYLDIVEHKSPANFNNSNLNAIWNREKEMMTHTIINELRKRTGNNLGDDPRAWIKKYSYDSAK
jgi:hypothetical protein